MKRNQTLALKFNLTLEVNKAQATFLVINPRMNQLVNKICQRLEAVKSKNSKKGKRRNQTLLPIHPMANKK
jgi:hypothetical protein